MRYAIATFLVGCTHSSSPAQPRMPLDDARNKVGTIELCKTTEQEVLASFGPAMRDGRQGTFRVRSWLIGKDPERILVVILDGHGRVVDLSWDTPGVVKWEPRDQCARSSSSEARPSG
jgi:hypothetical protein